MKLFEYDRKAARVPPEKPSRTISGTRTTVWEQLLQTFLFISHF